MTMGTDVQAFVFLIRPDGHSETIELEQVRELSEEAETLLWLHLDLRQPGARTWLMESSGLDATEVEALLADATRPRFTLLPHGVLLNLRGVNSNSLDEVEKSVSVRGWFEKNRVITASRLPAQAIGNLADLVRNGGQLHNAGGLVSHLAELLVEDVAAYVDGLEEELDTLIEQMETAAADTVRESIHRLQRSAILLRRFIAPQQLALSQFAESETKWLAQRPRRRLMESANEIARLVETLNFVWERARVLRDDLQLKSATETNRRLYLLSILSAIFLPLSFLTGLLGVNLGGIPGANFEQAFAILCVCILLLASSLGWWLKHSRWF